MFALANCLSVQPGSDWNIVDFNRRENLIGSGFVAVSDPQTGDLYGFKCEGRICRPEVCDEILLLACGGPMVRNAIRGAYGMCVAFALIASPSGNAQAQSGPQRSLAQCGKTESFLLAKKSLAEGETLIAKADYKEASRVLTAGIAALGYSYNSTPMHDDSDLKLGAARSEEHAGRLENAANLRAGVLRWRLELCGRN
jgi:hypothetical protein